MPKAMSKEITILTRKANIPDSPHFYFVNDKPMFRLKADDNGLAWEVSEANLWIVPIAADVACRWYDSNASAIHRKCADDGRVHLRYDIEDEPEYEEFQKNCDDATCWAVVADAARTKLGWPTPMPMLRDIEGMAAKKPEKMTQYKCPECGKGIMILEIVPVHQTKWMGASITIQNAEIFKCTTCGKTNVLPTELDRWKRSLP